MLGELFLCHDSVCDFVVLGFRKNAPGNEFIWVAVGAAFNDAVSLGVRYARQRGQLIFGSGVEVQRPVAAPALADAFGDSFRVSFHFGGGLRGSLFEFLRILLLWGARGEGEQQGNSSESV